MGRTMVAALPAHIAYGPCPADGSRVYLGERIADDWLAQVRPDTQAGQVTPFLSDLAHERHTLLVGGTHDDRVALTESVLLQVLLSGGKVVILDPQKVYSAFRGVPGVLTVTNDQSDLERSLSDAIRWSYSTRVSTGSLPNVMLAGDIDGLMGEALAQYLADHSMWLSEGRTLLSADLQPTTTFPEWLLDRFECRIFLGDVTPAQHLRLLPAHHLREAPSLRAKGRLRGHHTVQGSQPVAVQFAELSRDARWLLACLRAGYADTDLHHLDRDDPHVVAIVEMLGALRG